MRKCLVWLLLIVMLFGLSGCRRTARTEAEMVVLAQKELKLEQSMNCVFRQDEADRVLLVLESGGEFWPVTYEKQGNGYKLTQIHEPAMEGSKDCFMWVIRTGCLFVVTNEKCAGIRIDDGSRETEYIKVENLPFVYYYTVTSGGATYTFVDAEGNEVNRP